MKKRFVFSPFVLLLAMCGGPLWAATDSTNQLKPAVSSTTEKVTPQAIPASGAIDTTKKTVVIKDSAKTIVQESEKIPLAKGNASDTAKTKPAATPAVNIKTATPAPAKKTVKTEDLLEEEDLLLPEKGVDLPVKKDVERKKPDTATIKKEIVQKPDSGKVDSTKSVTQTQAVGTKNDSVGHVDTLPVVQQPQPDAVTVLPEKKNATAAGIEDARSINFAKNLKEYRSPKLAMLLSLVIPGAGQIYIGNQVNYIKAGAFLIAEAGIIGVSALYNSKGDAKDRQARAFADTTYDYKKMKGFYDTLSNFLHSKRDTATVNSILNTLYYDTLKGFDSSWQNGKPNKAFYQTIQQGSYVQGWKDCEPTNKDLLNSKDIQIIQNASYHYKYVRQDDTLDDFYKFTAYDTSSNGQAISGLSQVLGFSQYQSDYNKMVSQALDYHKVSTYILYAIVINHVLSALDALISANAYNSELLGKQTFWQKISVESTTTYAGIIPTTGICMKVRF